MFEGKTCIYRLYVGILITTLLTENVYILIIALTIPVRTHEQALLGVNVHVIIVI